MSNRLVRPGIFALLAGFGAFGLMYGTGSRTIDPSLGQAFTSKLPTLVSAWESGASQGMAQRDPGLPELGAAVHLTHLSRAKLASAPVVGDETYWLQPHSLGVMQDSALSLGSLITIAAGKSAPNHDHRSFEVIAMRPLAQAAGVDATNLPPSFKTAILVTARETGDAKHGATPHIITFLIDAGAGDAVATEAATRHL